MRWLIINASAGPTWQVQIVWGPLERASTRQCRAGETIEVRAAKRHRAYSLAVQSDC